jgi:hypothetical protein
MNAGDRQMVKGVECVRVPIMEAPDPEPCTECPHRRYNTEAKTCDSSCGGKYVWVNLIAYIAMKLEE